MLQSPPTLCIPWTTACQAPLSMGILQVNTEVGCHDLPDPEIEPTSSVAPALLRRFFTTVPPRKPQSIYSFVKYLLYLVSRSSLLIFFIVFICLICFSHAFLSSLFESVSVSCVNIDCALLYQSIWNSFFL